MSVPVHVIGATGRTGVVLCRMLAARATPIVAVVRDPARWAALGLPGEARRADLTNPATLAAALADATSVISVSYAAWTEAILAAAPPTARLILTGTARRYAAGDHPAGRDAAMAEALLLASGRDGAMLHPTMIYGAPNDGTVHRLADLIRRFRVLPLPSGGRALVQPIHVADVALALICALDRPWPSPAALPIAGPTPLPYAELVRAVARAANLRPPLILPIPAPRFVAQNWPALRRLLEDRTADITAMAEDLGVTARSLEQGLAETFRRAAGAIMA